MAQAKLQSSMLEALRCFDLSGIDILTLRHNRAPRPWWQASRDLVHLPVHRRDNE